MRVELFLPRRMRRSIFQFSRSEMVHMTGPDLEWSMWGTDTLGVHVLVYHDLFGDPVERGGGSVGMEKFPVQLLGWILQIIRQLIEVHVRCDGAGPVVLLLAVMLGTPIEVGALFILRSIHALGAIPLLLRSQECARVVKLPMAAMGVEPLAQSIV